MRASAEIRLSRHHSSYDSQAVSQIAGLRRILGPLAADIQHVGATAIRGILAVPVIDLAVSLKADADVSYVKSLLSRHGFYELPKDETGCIRMARKHREFPREAQSLYIEKEGHPALSALIQFKNYLNGHVFAANEYEELKKELARRHPADPCSYRAGKSRFVKNILRLGFTDPFLGRRLTIVIDHPIGSTDEQDPSLRYELNTGFVPGIPTPNGQKLEAYIYGVSKPLHRFTGTVIATVHRKDGEADLLIVAPNGLVAYEPMLAKAVAFREKVYDTGIICIYEKSCGGILYRRRSDGGIEYLILHQHRNGTWSVPKGHIAAGETEKETALREIREETGLSVTLMEGFRKELTYTVSAKASKNVVLFLAEATGELSLGENEISEALWMEKTAAIRRLGGRSIGHVVEAAETFLRARLGDVPPPL